MKITDITIPIDAFDKFFEDYVGDCGEDYVIIDADSHMNLFYDMDKPVKGRRDPFHRTYKGAKYNHFDLQIGWYIKDLDELEPFNHTLTIIRKKDLPSVCSTIATNKPTVTIQDESDRENGSAFVRITVNPNLEAKFCKNTEVLRLRLEMLRNSKLS